MFSSHKTSMVAPEQALPGRAEAIQVPPYHSINGNPLKGPFPAGHEQLVVGLGCFWGAERRFWECEGVFSTAVGYAGGFTPNPSYEEVCSGLTGHAEVVLVVYDPGTVTLETLLALFWESHDPTQGMRQGNDRGTQYRSVIYTFNDPQLHAADQSRAVYQSALSKGGFGRITTEIRDSGAFYYAEHYHQQYLAKNPHGYCGLGGLGIPAHAT